MITKFRSLVGSEDEATVKSGRDAMGEEQLTQLQRMQLEITARLEQIGQMQAEYDKLKTAYDSVLSTAHKIEHERDGLLLSLKVVTETIIMTGRQNSA
jgi:hypothetical protein